MKASRILALLSGVAVLGALADAAGPAAGSAGTVADLSAARLTAIRSHVSGRGATLVIEANQPVPYVASRPDPLTILVDFRKVGAEGVANFASRSGGPISEVRIEPTESLGVPATRVRITLTEPVAHRVRSDRNTIVVDFDKPSPRRPPYVLPPPPQVRPDDAMSALEPVERGTPDPIAALGLDHPASPTAPPPVGGSDGSLGAGTSASPAVPRATPVSRGQPPAAVPAAPSPDVSGQPIAARVFQSAAVQAGQTPPARAGQPPAAPAPPASAPAPTPSAQPSGQAPTRFTGHPISLDFQGADLRAVLRTFSEISGLNIVIDPAVTGTVDVALRDVPWDQALDIILRANKLGYLVDGTIVRIAPLSVLSDEEAAKRKLADEQAMSGNLQVLTKTLSYAKAEELQTLLTKSALSQRGSVQVDPRTNTLIITDLPERLTTASDLITTLDRPQPQVEIEARIVQTNKNYARALGVQWGFNGQMSQALGNTTNLAFPNSASITGRTAATQGPPGSASQAQPTGVNLPVSGATSAIGLQLGSVNGAFNLDLALSALESTGNGRILSTPRVSTQNNIEAEMTQGVQIPIQTVANNTVTVTFKDAALTLKVTPQITSANTVIMKISLDNSSPDFTRAVNGIPPINTQRAITQVLVNDAQTTVIGGIYTSTEQNQTDNTPGLARVPLLGWLFRRDSVTDQNTELLIFITPRIIRG